MVWRESSSTSSEGTLTTALTHPWRDASWARSFTSLPSRHSVSFVSMLFSGVAGERSCQKSQPEWIQSPS